jgi:deoxyribodipyrimidine photo-lyase
MQKKQNTTGLIWFRNNLRIHDNISLQKATENHAKVIAVYFFDPKYFKEDNFGFKKTAKFRAQFLIETITELKKSLAKVNIPLLTYFDAPGNKMHTLCDTFSINTIYNQKEWTTQEIDTNSLVAQAISKDIKIEEDYDQFLYHPNRVSNDYSNIPDVFTVFRKKLEKTVAVLSESKFSILESDNLIDNNTTIPTLKELGLDDFEIPEKTAFPFKGGENEALNRLDYYFFESKKLSFYKKTRNGLIGTGFSTKFSPWLANGSLSTKTIYWKVKEYEKKFGANQSTYWLIFELIWRDYFKYISLKHGNSIFKIGGILHIKYKWKNDEKLIQKWINGETKEPFVNANMIELKETGFMSNRGRQNVASYFSKELLLDWRIGAAYFESLLIDYDVHSNYGNWLYVAGVGNDPRDRKFNIKLQAERYDANATYQKMWLQTELF